MVSLRDLVARVRSSRTPKRFGPKRHRRRWRAECRLTIERLEDRSMMAGMVQFTINPLVDVKPISRYIYGVNQALDGAYSDGTLTRLGGNRWTAYNWENNASNAGIDYFFQNDAYLGGGSTPGGAVIPRLQNASARNAAAIVTVPINGYVSADKNGGGDVRNSGSNYLQTRFRQEFARKGSAFSLTPNLTDASVYQDEFVNWVTTTFPQSKTDPNRPIWFALDNEPDLWAESHAAIHPGPVTYAELVQKTIDYADAIKDIAPHALVLGPDNYGWDGFVRLQGAPDRAGRDFQEFYLAEMRKAETATGHRLIDALDVHWYPEAQGGGVRITGTETTDAVVAARLQAPRSLWDPTYTETSWITQWSTNGPINLLPRLQAKIDANYPGTKLAVTEYNYGGGQHISGGIAQADVLGIFGRQGVFAAAKWPLTSNESFLGAGFQMFRNFDGKSGRFGDTSVRTKTDNAVDSSVYASLDSTNPNVLVLVAINKSNTATTAAMNFKHIAPGASAAVYQLTGAAATPVSVGTLSITDPANFSYTMPALSVSTLRVNLAVSLQPTIATAASANPHPVTGTTTQLHVLGADNGGEANLTYIWSVTAQPTGAASPTFSTNGTNAAKNATVTFSSAGSYTFTATVSDGLYTTTSSVAVTVNPTLASIVVTPPTATINAGGSQQFAASGRDQFGTLLATLPAMVWSVLSGGGAITASGLYTAPAIGGSATVRATSGGVLGSATLTIQDPVQPLPPSNLAASVISRNSITLSWRDNSAIERGFLIERSLDGVTFVRIGWVGANEETYTATDLAADTLYYFRVRPLHISARLAYSDIVLARTWR
jgi:hypothetical protein